MEGEEAIELADQFILRLPTPYAEAVKDALKSLKPKKFKKFLTISLDKSKKNMQTGFVKVDKQKLQGKLVNLPCIIESYKTEDKSYLFKTADITQMLVCEENATDQNLLHPHGLTPPLKNIRKQRFRKMLRNKEDLEEVAEVEKEVLWLLRADNEAVSTRYEFFFEETAQATVNECALFGEVISDSDSEQVTAPSSPNTSTSELNGNLENQN